MAELELFTPGEGCKPSFTDFVQLANSIDKFSGIKSPCKYEKILLYLTRKVIMLYIFIVIVNIITTGLQVINILKS